MKAVMPSYLRFVTSALLACVLLTSLQMDEVGKAKKEIKMNKDSSFQDSLQNGPISSPHPLNSDREGIPQSSLHMFTLLRQAGPETQAIARAAEAQEIALQSLKGKAAKRVKKDLKSTEEIEAIANLSGCPPPTKSKICPNGCLSEKYRTISGICNNRHNPLWGAANTAFSRWLPAEYEDEQGQPKGWNPGHLHNGFRLPLVREVSNKIMQRSSKHVSEDDAYSQMLVDWGQYIDHDISFTPQCIVKAASLGGPDCLETCENINPCFPIKIPRNDKLSGKRSCLPFFRSSPACPSPHTDGEDPPARPQRQQMNAITSFLDASTVYGHTPALEGLLRDLSSAEGLLAVNTRFSDGGFPYLPFVPSIPSGCLQDPGDLRGERVECFLAGDSRVSEILPLSALHTLWLREHNRIAAGLKELNAHWSHEQTYQEARKIVGALHQVITFRDYAPKILGREAFEKYIGVYEGYDRSINPTVSNVFATAAFRFGHATIAAVVLRLNESFQEHERHSPVSLHDTFFSPWRLVKEGGLDPILRGLLGRPAIAVTTDHLMTEELTERLIVLSSPGDLDLTALNLQRGRDHGLPGYNKWREFCGYERIQTQAELSRVISDASLVQKIMELYQHPRNIDVWLAGLVEDLLPGARTGPLFACLIGKQLKMLREGDRFWWENEGMFTDAQRAEIQRHSLSRVICDNSGLNEVPTDPFRLKQYPKDFQPCKNLPTMNLKAWQEDLSKELMPCGSPAELENGDFVFCSISGKLVAAYSCRHGYRLEGQEEILCTERGWSSQPPICKGDRPHSHSVCEEKDLKCSSY
ncbi:thyroid peroxidase isoform X2 [Brienomyrus brachyistius]|uniref:thyroid peroxidase isoform X2 n=1 Tax=Brienomyrus brachyistius TaxID=42636 RepID=UPI0020B3D84D|nr:thyroid peroxidase isoform X2 [Brienomyrus brachyistius]